MEFPKKMHPYSIIKKFNTMKPVKIIITSMKYLIFIIAIVGLNSYVMYKPKKKYEWFASGNAPKLYPTKMFFGNYILANGSKLYIPPKIVFQTTWGASVGMDVSSNNFRAVPVAIDIVWYSIMEDKFYSVEAPLPSEKIEELLKLRDKQKEPVYIFIVAGMAPYGDLAIWLTGGGIRTAVAWIKQGEEVEVEWKDFLPYSGRTREEYTDSSKQRRVKAYENYLQNGLPDRHLFDRYMQKFNYRITPRFENANAMYDNDIWLYYYSGELHTNRSTEHLSNAMRAKLRKIVLNWTVGNTEYGGYFWTDEKKIIDTFNRFYGDDTQKEGNLVIEVGKTNDKFAFYLQGETSRVDIPLDEIEIIVFKNGREIYRSPNYSKPPGGWSQ
jgi:hypothetical protein